MNQLFFVTVSVLLASSVFCQQAVKFFDCGPQKTIQNLFVTCEANSVDCELQAEKSYIFDIRFVSPVAANRIESEMIRQDNIRGVEGLTDNYSYLSCPLEEGQDFTFFQTVTVARDAPRGRAIIHGELTNENKTVLACYNAEVVYVDYKPCA